MGRTPRGDNSRREVELRHAEIRKLLKEGHSVADVCRLVGITPKRVYVVAERYDLPTNPKIWPNSDDECSIARLVVAGWPISKVGKIFNQSPKSVQAILNRIKERPILDASAKRFGVEEGSPGAGGLKGAKASPNARRRRRS